MNFLLVLATILIMSIPLFFPNSFPLENLLSTPISQLVRQEKSALQVMRYFSVASMVPAVVDVSADLISFNAAKSIHEIINSPVVYDIGERLLLPFLFALINIVSIVVFNSRDDDAPDLEYLTQYFISCLWCIMVMVGGCIASKFAEHQVLPYYGITIAQILFYLSRIVRLYEVSMPWMKIPQFVFPTLYYPSVVLLFSGTVIWANRQMSRYVWKRLEPPPNEIFELKESLIGTYLSIFIILIICTFSLRFSSNRSDWTDGSLNFIMGMYWLFSVFSATVAMLPGRLCRMAFQKSLDMLNLKRVFIRYVSHEVRSPLGALKAAIELLLKDMPNQQVTESFKELLFDLQVSTCVAVDLLNDLLDYESMDAGTFKLELRANAIMNLFKDGTFKILNLMARAHEVNLSFQFPDENNPLLKSFCVFVDAPKLLNQIIRNLVSNAVKFTKSGGQVSLTFKVSAGPLPVDILNAIKNNAQEAAQRYAAGHSVAGVFSIEVQDTGAGISEENIKKMFNQFTQFDRTSLQGGGGSGLGLWICKSIVTRHGGVINVESKGLNKGATFRVDLPIFVCHDDEMPHIVTIRRASVHPSNSDESVSRTASVVPTIKRRSMAGSFFTDGDIGPSDIPSIQSPQAMRSDIQHALQHVRKVFPLSEITSQLEITEGTQALESYIKSADNENNQNSSYFDPSAAGIDQNIATQKGSSHLDRPVKIIIVDDSLMNRKLLRKLIEAERSRFMAPPFIIDFVDGKDVVTFFKENREEAFSFDCILMDFIMVNLHGPDTVTILRKDLRYRGLIFGVTGNVMPTDIELFEQSGVDAVFTKPITMDRLLVLMSESGLAVSAV